MNILILGGTQFVSQSIAERLILEGHSVYIFTRGILGISFSGVTRHFLGNRQIENDLLQLKQYAFDIVIDCSAYLEEDMQYIFNVLDTKCIKKYILISSGAVYPPSMVEINELVQPQYNVNWGEYGENKYKVEKRLIANSDDFSAIVLRPTYIYGENNNLYREYYFYKQIKSKSKIPIPEGNAKVQFIYIKDFVEIISDLLYRDDIGTEIFNITNPEIYTWKTYIKCISDILQTPAQVVEVSEKKFRQVRRYFPFRNCTYLLDVNKLSSYHLNKSTTSLCSGLKNTFDSYLKIPPPNVDEKMNQINNALMEGNYDNRNL